MGAHQRGEALRQLTHWPQENIIYQPANRDTAPGIMLPLSYITHRDPSATVIVSPSDHFVRDENRFMDAVAGALAVLKRHSDKSDWGTVASILRSLIEIGQLESFRMRLEESQVHPSWYAASLAEIDPQSKDLAPQAVYSSIRTEVEAYRLQISRSTYRSAQSFRQEGAAGSLSISRRVHDELQSTTMYISRLGD